MPPALLLDVLQAALALGLGVVFLASALPKLRHPRGFVLAVLEYRILPSRLSWIFARLLPPVELLVALLLLSGTLPRFAAVVATVLLLCFLAAAGLNLARGRRMDCACFGKSRKRVIGARVLLEDTLLLAVSALLVVLRDGGDVASWSVWRVVALGGWPQIGVASAVVVLAAVVCALMLALNPAVARRLRHRLRQMVGIQPARSGLKPV